MFKLVICGPESTGKTELASLLAHRFSIPYIPEYARDYIEKLGRPYQFEDVEHIARVQWDQYRKHSMLEQPLLILDTFLIITKIWFKEVFRRIPEWIDKSLREAEIDLFLLCYPDLEWVEDPVRENPGEKRLELFELYYLEILQLGCPCSVIRGHGSARFTNALTAIETQFPGLKI